MQWRQILYWLRIAISAYSPAFDAPLGGPVGILPSRGKNKIRVHTQQRLDGFSPNVHATDVFPMLFVNGGPMKIGPPKFWGVKTSTFWRKTRRNSRKTITTGITTITRLLSHTSLVTFSSGELDLSGSRELSILATACHWTGNISKLATSRLPVEKISVKLRFCWIVSEERKSWSCTLHVLSPPTTPPKQYLPVQGAANINPASLQSRDPAWSRS